MVLNERITSIAPSASLEVEARAKAMAAAGEQICGFGAGEPDFDTPEHIKAAAAKALANGQTKYAPTLGIPALRKAIVTKLQHENGLEYAPGQVLVSNGAKHSLFNLFLVLCREGDEVLIPSPYWLSYPEMVRIAGATPVDVVGRAENGYKISPADLRAAATKRTRVLVLNSPCNPSGIVYTPAELGALAEVAVERNWTIISDEVYEKIVYDGAVSVSVAGLSPEIFARTVTVNGFSKAYAMTGWRLGYAAGPQPVINAALTLQSHSASGANTFAQYGALAALEGPQDFIARMVAAFTERRACLYERLTAISGISCVRPMGAFYMLPDVSSFGVPSHIFAQRLLEREKVAVVPGESFGAPGCVRFSYACSLKNIEEGMSRFARFVRSL